MRCGLGEDGNAVKRSCIKGPFVSVWSKNTERAFTGPLLLIFIPFGQSKYFTLHRIRELGLIGTPIQSSFMPYWYHPFARVTRFLIEMETIVFQLMFIVIHFNVIGRNHFPSQEIRKQETLFQDDRFFSTQIRPLNSQLICDLCAYLCNKWKSRWELESSYCFWPRNVIPF